VHGRRNRGLVRVCGGMSPQPQKPWGAVPHKMAHKKFLLWLARKPVRKLVTEIKKPAIQTNLSKSSSPWSVFHAKAPAIS